MNNPQELPKFTVAEIGLLLSIVTPTILYVVNRFFDRKKAAAEAKKLEADTKKSDEDAKKVSVDADTAKSTIRKLEAEIAEKYITSAGELVGEYKTMLDNLNTEFKVIKEKLKATDEKLDAEIENRRALERVTVEIYTGVKKLMEQIVTANMSPNWEISAHIETELQKLRERHEIFGAD